MSNHEETDRISDKILNGCAYVWDKAERAGIFLLGPLGGFFSGVAGIIRLIAESDNSSENGR